MTMSQTGSVRCQGLNPQIEQAHPVGKSIKVLVDRFAPSIVQAHDNFSKCALLQVNIGVGRFWPTRES